MSFRHARLTLRNKEVGGGRLHGFVSDMVWD